MTRMASNDQDGSNRRCVEEHVETKSATAKRRARRKRLAQIMDEDDDMGNIFAFLVAIRAGRTPIRFPITQWLQYQVRKLAYVLWEKGVPFSAASQHPLVQTLQKEMLFDGFSPQAAEEQVHECMLSLPMRAARECMEGSDSEESDLAGEYGESELYSSDDSSESVRRHDIHDLLPGIELEDTPEPLLDNGALSSSCGAQPPNGAAAKTVPPSRGG